MAQPYTLPLYTFHKNDGSGEPIADGFVGTYITNTTTPKDTYVDSLGVTPAQNPIPLDANGQCQIWFGTGAYKLVVYDNFMNIIYTMDPVAATDNPDASLVNTIAELRDLPPGAAKYLFVLGYFSPNDWGGGHIYWDATSTAVDNGYNVFKPNSINVSVAGRWRRTKIGVPNVIMAGAKPNNSDDTYVPIKTILGAEDEFYFPPGGYYTSQGWVVTSNKTIVGMAGSTIYVTGIPAAPDGHNTNKRPVFDLRGSSITIRNMRFTSNSRNTTVGTAPNLLEEETPPCAIELNGVYDGGTSSNYCSGIKLLNNRVEYMMGGIWANPGFVTSFAGANLFPRITIEDNYFEDITIQDIARTGGSPNPSTAFCMYLEGLDTPTVQRNYIDNATASVYSGHKITLIGCPYALVNANTILDKKSEGVGAVMGLNISNEPAIQFNRNTITDGYHSTISSNIISQASGIYSDCFHSSSITDNKFDSIDGSYGIYVFSSTSSSPEANLVNSVISNNLVRFTRPSTISSSSGIQLSGGTIGCVVDSNSVSGVRFSGIDASGCQDVVISNNTINGKYDPTPILAHVNKNNGSGKLAIGFYVPCPFENGDRVNINGFSNPTYNPGDATLSNKREEVIGTTVYQMYDITAISFTTTASGIGSVSFIGVSTSSTVPDENIVYPTTSGISFTTSYSFNCTGNTISNTSRAGIWYKGDSYGIIDSNSVFNTATGILNSDNQNINTNRSTSTGTLILNNRVTGSREWGIDNQSANFYGKYLNNLVTYSLYGGMNFNDNQYLTNPEMSHVTVSGNDLSENEGPGLLISNWHGMTITNNTMRNSSQQWKSSILQSITVTAAVNSPDNPGYLEITMSGDHGLYNGYLVKLQGFGVAGYNKLTEIRNVSNGIGGIDFTKFLCLDIPWTATTTFGTYLNMTAPLTVHYGVSNIITGNNLTGVGNTASNYGPEYSIVFTRDFSRSIVSQNMMGHINSFNVTSAIYIDNADSNVITYNLGTVISSNVFMQSDPAYSNLPDNNTLRSLNVGGGFTTDLVSGNLLYKASWMKVTTNGGSTLNEIAGGTIGDIIVINNGGSASLTVVHNFGSSVGAIALSGGVNRVMAQNTDFLTLMRVSDILWVEISSSKLTA